MATDKYEKELQDQIGSMGGEPNANENKSLGQIKHREICGEKPKLSKEEKTSLDDFISKSNKAMHSSKTKVEEAPYVSQEHYTPMDSPSISDGWVPISREEMGLRSMFYPASWEFYIKPASVNAIKNWTSIDEKRLDQVNNVFNDIVKSCVKIETKDITKASWDKINMWDRFWFILKIREYTFPSTKDSKVTFEDVCSECGENMTYTLTSEGLFYSYPDDEIIEKYWNGRNWVIDPREYGLEHENIELFIPTLGKLNSIINWASNRTRNNQYLDETFTQKYLMWLLDKPANDLQILDRQIQKIYNEYKQWDLDTFTFMTDVINNIDITPSEKLKSICPSCGQEATSNVQFPNGVKSLFAVKSNIKKFGSR